MSSPDTASSDPATGAAFTVDLSGSAAAETGGAKFGRIVGGILLCIVGLLVALGCGLVFIASPFVPALWDWAEILGDAALFIGAIALGLAFLGFEMARRGRKANIENYAHALSMVPGVDGFDDEPVFDPTRTVQEDNPNRTYPDDPNRVVPGQNKPGKTVV